jgi:non-ribosomal peptide synthetase component F
MVSLFDLTVHAVEAGNVLGFSWEYSTALFKKERIRRFFGYFRNTAAGLIKNPGQTLAELEIISEEEKRQILHEFNDTAVEFPGPGTLHELLAEQAERTPDGVADLMIPRWSFPVPGRFTNYWQNKRRGRPTVLPW